MIYKLVISCDALGIFVSSAKVVVELAKTGAIEASVLLHPSFVSVDDIKGMFIFVFGNLLASWFAYFQCQESLKVAAGTYLCTFSLLYT